MPVLRPKRQDGISRPALRRAANGRAGGRSFSLFQPTREIKGMAWLRLTQANTGMAIHVNMAQVVVIAPNKTGGSALLTLAMEKDSARIVPVKESPQEVADLMARAESAPPKG